MPPRSRTRLTKSLVDNLRPGQIAWDAEIRGFGVRRQKNDRAFILKCNVRGRQKFLTIGKYGSPWTLEQARKEARHRLLKVANGLDPGTHDKFLRSTVADLCDEYLRRHAPTKKRSSAHSDRRNIENHVLPLLGRQFVSEITKSDIEEFHQAVKCGATAPADPKQVQRNQRGGQPVRGGQGVANRCLTLLSKMFTLSEDWQMRPPHSNPVRRVKRYVEVPRRRFLSKDEMARLGLALSSRQEQMPYAVGAIRLLLLTGARLGEILNLRWDHVDLDRALINLPDSKTGQKTIHLSKPAVTLLQEVPRLASNSFVIAGKKSGASLVNLQKSWIRVCKDANLADVRLHDLRHTFASIGLSQGLSLSVIGSLLGHKSTETTSRYAHLVKDHVAASNEELGKALETLLSSSSS